MFKNVILKQNKNTDKDIQLHFSIIFKYRTIFYYSFGNAFNI